MIEFFPDMQNFLRIGSITIAWYAIFIVSAAFITYYLSLKSLKKMGYTSEDAETLFYGVLIFGVLGARLWYVLFFDLSYYLADPIRILQFREGGMAIHGGIFGGALYGYYFANKRGINFMHWLDAILPNVLLAQAIGRWGNFMNQEAFGGIVGEEHFKYIPTFIKNNMFIDGAYRAPTFLYESILNLIGWVLITQVLRRSKKLKRGDQSFAYLMWYGIVRFIIEGFRTDALPLNLGFIELRIAQVISVVFVIVGIMGYFGMFKKLYESPKPILIFDFDGTVMDTQALILETFRQVFEKNLPGQVISEEEYLSFIGPTLYESFGRYFKQEEVDDMVAEYRRLNLELHDEYVKPMDHAKEVLFELKEKGYKMAVVSSKVREPIMVGLELTGMEDLFDPVLGMDNYDKVKPHPEGILKVMEDCFYDRSSFIYIGDTKTDIEAGRKAGAFTIGYVFDKNREQALNDSQPNAIMHDWRELPEILEGDHEWTYNTI